VNTRWSAACSDHATLYDWSIREPEKFWQSMWSFAGVVGDMGAGPYLIDANKMPGARWFPQARLNFAANLLRRRDHDTALVF
jgi:acetoacetyl-CoA synthetase